MITFQALNTLQVQWTCTEYTSLISHNNKGNAVEMCVVTPFLLLDSNVGQNFGLPQDRLSDLLLLI